MFDVETSYQEAIEEFEMASNDTAAFYWWGRVQMLEAIMMQEREEVS